MSKLSYEDKNNIYQERKKENETKEEENIHHIKALLAKLLIIKLKEILMQIYQIKNGIQT